MKGAAEAPLYFYTASPTVELFHYLLAGGCVGSLKSLGSVWWLAEVVQTLRALCERYFDKCTQLPACSKRI